VDLFIADAMISIAKGSGRDDPELVLTAPHSTHVTRRVDVKSRRRGGPVVRWKPGRVEPERVNLAQPVVHRWVNLLSTLEPRGAATSSRGATKMAITGIARRSGRYVTPESFRYRRACPASHLARSAVLSKRCAPGEIFFRARRSDFTSLKRRSYFSIII